ncbi:hypothetical protein DBR47_03465 [Paucibacter sp. KBW04]|nr:hypothetical protein DBR47_03465 [Paucibacter sp. KBW04]
MIATEQSFIRGVKALSFKPCTPLLLNLLICPFRVRPSTVSLLTKQPRTCKVLSIKHRLDFSCALRNK